MSRSLVKMLKSFRSINSRLNSLNLAIEGVLEEERKLIIPCLSEDQVLRKDRDSWGIHFGGREVSLYPGPSPFHRGDSGGSKRDQFCCRDWRLFWHHNIDFFPLMDVYEVLLVLKTNQSYIDIPIRELPDPDIARDLYRRKVELSKELARVHLLRTHRGWAYLHRHMNAYRETIRELLPEISRWNLNTGWGELEGISDCGLKVSVCFSVYPLFEGQKEQVLLRISREKTEIFLGDDLPIETEPWEIVARLRRLIAQAERELAVVVVDLFERGEKEYE